MRKIQRIAAVATALVTAACSRDSGRLLEPEGPLMSTWTRTYTVSGVTYLNGAFASYSGGYVIVELVSDSAPSTAFQVDEVQADGEPASFYKPANYSLRLTGVATLSNCTFAGWILSTPTGSTNTTSTYQINMDDLRPYSWAKGRFNCT